MDNRYVPKTIEIDLIELMWRMLAQWKAILIVAIVFAILVPSAIYLKSMRAYKAELAVETEHAEKVMDIDQATEKILSELDDAERQAVEQALINDDIIDAKQDYLINSLLVNLNIDEASTVSIGYVLTNVNENSMQSALTSGYSSALWGDKALDEIMAAMGVDSKHRYVKELISIEESVNENMAGVVKVTVICPNASTNEAVTEAVHHIIKRSNKTLSKSVTDHNIKRIYVNRASISPDNEALANPDIVGSAKSAAYNDLYNLQSVQRGHIGTFSEEQTAAYEEIKTLKAEATAATHGADAKAGEDATSKVQAKASADMATSEDPLGTPDYSMKYALVGFIFGIILYVGIYIVWQILSRRIDNARAAANYTRTRLLGEYYYRRKRSKLFNFLFSTDVVTKYKYGKKMNLATQADIIADEIDASCKNKHIQEITLLKVFKADTVFLTAVANKLKTSFQIIDVFPSADAKDLADKKHVVFFVASSTKAANVDSSTSLCVDYGIEGMGTVFIGEV